MNPLKQYKIGFVGLSTGKHHFSFDIGPDFFLLLGDAAYETGRVVLELDLVKGNNMMELCFHFSGEVQLQCDRCLETYDHSVDLQRQLLVKFGEQYSEQSDEIIIIPQTESHLDISQFVYEFIHLGMPVKKVHQGEDLMAGCDPEVVKKLEQYLQKQQETGDDSPWNVLKALKFNT